MPPQQVANIVFGAIREERFYILTHPAWKSAIQIRMEDMLQERNPTLPESLTKAVQSLSSRESE
jgi:hypothetical protein